VIGDSEGIITMQYGTFEDLQVYKAAREYRKKNIQSGPKIAGIREV
jgi:hypothetical protein